jgi:polysaccharide deacetylase family protein (PEP-CTERM system associated)
MLNAFSVDVEDWFHILHSPMVPPMEQWDSLESCVERGLEQLLKMLDETNTRATFFWLGWLAERHGDLVRKCQRQGHEIASHGYAHVLPWEVGAGPFKDDIVRAKKILEDITGEQIQGFRTAGFGITGHAKWALDVIAEAGYQYDSSVAPPAIGRGTKPACSDGMCATLARGDRPACKDGTCIVDTRNGPLIEVPVTGFVLFGLRLGLFGGGYLRVLPKWFLRLATWNLRVSGYPLVLYVHPREIEPDHPRLPLSTFKRFKCYINLGSTMSKLRFLCERYRFVPIRELVGEFSDR